MMSVGTTIKGVMGQLIANPESPQLPDGYLISNDGKMVLQRKNVPHIMANSHPPPSYSEKKKKTANRG
jgi:hypothetical protein